MSTNLEIMTALDEETPIASVPSFRPTVVRDSLQEYVEYFHLKPLDSPARRRSDAIFPRLHPMLVESFVKHLLTSKRL